MEIKSMADLRFAVSALPKDTKLVVVTVKQRIDDKMHEEIREPRRAVLGRANAHHHRAAASDVCISKDVARCSACMVLLC